LEKKDRIFLIDFDNTLTNKDTTDTIMIKYNKTLLDNYQNRIRKGEINVKEYLSGLLESLTISKEDFYKSIGDNVDIDNNFINFKNQIEDFRIVSAGTYENIFAVLEKNKINIDKKMIYANELLFLNNNKIKIEYPFDVDDCFEGVCKKSIVKKYKELYKEVVFIGDGLSDISVCGVADIIFARRDHSLEKYCEKNNISHIKYDDFDDIIKYYIK